MPRRWGPAARGPAPLHPAAPHSAPGQAQTLMRPDPLAPRGPDKLAHTNPLAAAHLSLTANVPREPPGQRRNLKQTEGKPLAPGYAVLPRRGPPGNPGALTPRTSLQQAESRYLCAAGAPSFPALGEPVTLPRLRD